MKCVLKFFFVLVVLIPEIVSAQSNAVSLSDKNVHWIGRVTNDHIFGWGGSGLQFNISGSDLSFELNCKLGPAYMNVVVNGINQKSIRIENGTKTYSVKIDKPKKVNSISLIKSTEAHTGHFQLKSLKISGDLKEKSPLKKKILFIGDSITCGYGNLSSSHKEHFKIETEDVFYTYGYVAARKMDWEFNSVAWSGKGMLRNYGKGDDAKRYENTIPKIFSRTLPHKPNVQWDFKTNIPDMICINLGTNDNAGGNLSKEKYIAAYKKFLVRLRTYYPNKPIINLVGPLYNGKQYKYMEEWITEACKDMKDTHVLKLPKGKGPQELGAAWHPNKAHHIRMGEFLGPELLKLAK